MGTNRGIARGTSPAQPVACILPSAAWSTRAALSALFICKPKDGGALIPPKPGQHLTLRVPVGTNNALVDAQLHCIQSASGESLSRSEYYRISVKREAAGLSIKCAALSSMLVGQRTGNQSPKRPYSSWTAKQQRPGVLIGAGVGITPMVAMANDALNEGLRSSLYSSL